jgi:hypothetical protein
VSQMLRDGGIQLVQLTNQASCNVTIVLLKDALKITVIPWRALLPDLNGKSAHSTFFKNTFLNLKTYLLKRCCNT